MIRTVDSYFCTGSARRLSERKLQLFKQEAYIRAGNDARYIFSGLTPENHPVQIKHCLRSLTPDYNFLYCE